MRRICNLIAALMLVLGLCACGQSAQAKWQEQYDLGVRYLSEGNYEEAIIAFTAAIEIDAKRPEGFIGRGDAYALSGDTEDNLSAAQADYEAAIALDETLPGAWLGLADVYIRRGDYEKAIFWLNESDIDLLSVEQQEAYSFRLAYSLLQTGEWEKARGYFARIEQIGTTYKEASSYYIAYIDYWLGEATGCIAVGDFAEALTKLEVLTVICEQLPQQYSVSIENIF